MDLLRRTSEKFSLPTEDIRERLNDMRAGGVDLEGEDSQYIEDEHGHRIERVGIACHRHTLVKDIEALGAYGYDVKNTGDKAIDSVSEVDGVKRPTIVGICDEEKEAIERWGVKRTRANRYFMAMDDSNRFSNSELRLLELATQSMRMLNDESRREIVAKLRSQALDSHVYDYVDGTFSSKIDGTLRNRVGNEPMQLRKAPMERQYYWDAGGEELEVGDTCREFMCNSTWSVDSAAMAQIIDPIEEALLSGSMLKMYTYDWDNDRKAYIRLKDGLPWKKLVYPLAFASYDGKQYLLTIDPSSKTFRNLNNEDIANGYIDRAVYPYRLDSICYPGLSSHCSPEWSDEYAIEVIPQVKRYSEVQRHRKKGTDREREEVLAKVIRNKKWLANPQNFDKLLRRNPHMFFDATVDPRQKEPVPIEVSFKKSDLTVLRNVRDHFGEAVSVKEDGDYYRAVIQVYSRPLFAQWLAGFTRGNDENGQNKLHIVSPNDRELQKEFHNLQARCLECLYGNTVSASRTATFEHLADQIVAEVDPLDLHVFMDILTKRFCSDSSAVGDYRLALEDSLNWIHKNR